MAVYITQEKLKKTIEGVMVQYFDLTSARQFGELHVVVPAGTNVHNNPAELLRLIRVNMADYKFGDYLLPVGDMLVIAMCAVVAAEKSGSISMLKWDRSSRTYVPVQVDLVLEAVREHLPSKQWQ